MTPLSREHPILCGSIVVGVLAGCAGWGFVFHLNAESQAKQSDLRHAVAILDSHLQRTPTLNSQSRDAAESHLATLRERRATLLQALGADANAAPDFAGSGEDLYFQIIAYTERMRDHAARAEVEVRAEAANFGFAEIIGSGEVPSREALDTLYRHKHELAWLLDRLLEARPSELLRVSRISGGGNARSTREPGDRFPVANAVEIAFIGHTDTLRKWLLGIGADARPILIRSISVIPAGDPETGEAGHAANPFASLATAAESQYDRRGTVPIVRSRPSVFQVAFESIDFPRPSNPREGARP